MFGVQMEKHQKIALAVFIILCVIGLGYSYHVKTSGDSGEVIFRESDLNGENGGSGEENTTQSQGKLIFQVAGNVKSPGVYSLPVGKRIIDALKAAGGPLPGADLDSLNLAAHIEDASKIYVPLKGETASGNSGSTYIIPPPARPAISSPDVNASSSSAYNSPRRIHLPPVKISKYTSSSSKSSGKIKSLSDGTVNINSADINELTRLPGVGPSTAQKILDYRNQSGKFTSVEQIMEVKGIGPSKYEKMRMFIRI